MQKAIIEKCKDFYMRVEAIEKGREIGDYMYPSKDPNDLAQNESEIQTIISYLLY